MRLVGLDPARLPDYPHQFSGGMRQRASIALALALEPALVIANEPVTALDVIVQRQLLDVLRDLQQRLHLAMLLVAPSGCRFADRCPFVEARCRHAPPPLVEVAPEHHAACWRSDAAVALRARATRPETWAV